jgi:hypothetical protein
VILANSLPPSGAIAIADWVGPLAELMRLQGLSTSANASDRYAVYTTKKVFVCPSAEGVATASYQATPTYINAGVRQQLGYATAWSFMLSNGSPTSGVTDQTRISTGSGWWVIPPSYLPRITKVGNSSEKIFAADAGKFSNGTAVLTYNLFVDPTPNSPGRNSGPYTDFGPWTNATAGYDRDLINGGASVIDGRTLSYRHGTQESRKPVGAYRLNAVFYDGHAENLDEMRACNPAFWLPRGTTVNPAGTFSSGRPVVWPDVRARYMAGMTTFTAP